MFFIKQMFFLQFRLKLGMFGGVREDRMNHTYLFGRSFTGFGLTRHQKVNFSTFDGRLKFQCTRNGIQNLPHCPGSIQDTFVTFSSISHHQISQNDVAKNKTLENRKSQNLKIQKPRILTSAQNRAKTCNN